MSTTERPARTAPVAEQLAEALRPVVRGELPVRLRAWDGSEAGPVDAPLVELRTPEVLRRLLWHPGELGAAQAYVTGELEIHHDVDDALTHVWAVAAERGLKGVRPSPRALVAALRTLASLGAIGPRPANPASQARIPGRLHSKRRDSDAISFHYDLSNEFYELILEPCMAYSSGYWTAAPDDPSYSSEDAQRDKLDLVCRKIGLEPGMRFLDIGCGWGSLSLHAAEHFGAQVTGVTIAAEQKRFIDARIAERGLGDRVDIRLLDYRDVPRTFGGTFGGGTFAGTSGEGAFDAVASIEMGEHVGEGNYPTYAQVLHDSVKPGGRVLIQQMSRSGKHPGGGPFIENFIAPDMTMRPIGETVAHLERGGLEVRDVHMMREHYVRTVAAWMERFEKNLPRLTELVGEEVVRVWRLYLVGGAMAFRDGRMGVDQILMVKPGAAHTLPWKRDW